MVVILLILKYPSVRENEIQYKLPIRQQQKNVCLGFPYLHVPYFFALKSAYPNIFMVILA